MFYGGNRVNVYNLKGGLIMGKVKEEFLKQEHIKECLFILENVDKPIFYKKGRHGRLKKVASKDEAKKLFLKCEDGAIMEYPKKVEIWDYDEIDWLS